MFHYHVPVGEVIDLRSDSDDDSIEIVPQPQVLAVDHLAPNWLPLRRVRGEIEEKPVPKSAMKYNRRMNNGRGGYYYPSTAAQIRVANAIRANRLLDHYDVPGPIPGPLTVRVTFYYRATRLSQLGKPYIKKPDLDNLQKLLFDAMKHADVFEDDMQLYNISAVKKYCRIWGAENRDHTMYSVRAEDDAEDVV